MPIKFLSLKESVSKFPADVKIIKAKDYVDYKTTQDLWVEVNNEKKRQEVETSELKLKSIENGLLKGAEEAKARMANEMLKSASSLATQIKAIEQDLADVVKSAVRKIISDFDDDKLVLEAVKKGLQPVYQNQRVAVRVNPQMLPTVLSGIENINHQISFLDIQPDDRLKNTDCIIESDIGIVNASIESQLSAIEKAIDIRYPQKKAS